MRFFSAAIVSFALLLATPGLATPTSLKPIVTYKGETSGKHIVQLKPGVSRHDWINKLNLNSTTDWELINGFAGKLDDSALNLLRLSPDVEYIAEDGIMHTMALVQQTNAPWGLQRISQAAKLTNQNSGALNFKYVFDDSAGVGVDIYIVDTGIMVTHADFQGRARFGASFINGIQGDAQGHGTHCAGTAAGSLFGVAKGASLIAVKVLDDIDGSGSTSGIVAGMNWILQQAKSSGRPTVVSMSLGGDVSPPLDNGVAALTSAGIHVVVAAGNDNVDAKNTSPARAPSAITVGASNIADRRASFSNYGAVVDIFAAGENIISTWIGSNTAVKSISGTSMATPHIAGLVAYFIAKDGNLAPAAMAKKLQSLSIKGALVGVPAGTVNLLAKNM